MPKQPDPRMLPGQKHSTNYGVLEILEYAGRADITVKFVKTGTVMSVVNSGNIRTGCVRDPCFPSVAGVGFVGIGKYEADDNKCYNTWSNMIRRCYAPANERLANTYIGCTVVVDWHCYQKFAAWYVKQPYAWLDDYELDKDLRVPGNKTYGPKACSIIPTSINRVITGFGRGGKYGTGVMRQPCGSFWAQMRKGSKQVYVGPFATASDAAAEYKIYYINKMRKIADRELAKNRISCAQHRLVILYAKEVSV